MSFQFPEYLKAYLDSAKYRKPFENFVNNSSYYSQLNWQWINYMESVVRPCIAYSTAVVDGIHNTSLSTSTGLALLKGATRLIVGDRFFFIGDDEQSRFMEDIFVPKTGFVRTVTRAVNFMNAGGTAVLKLNINKSGCSYISTFRIDRTLIAANDNGDVTSAIFFIGLLSQMQGNEESNYWLVEERKYSETGKPVIVYKVFHKASTAQSLVLPSPYRNGIPYEQLPKSVKGELKRIGAGKLNNELPLGTRDGLGVWLMQRTATNSCVPDAPLGDPLLYGCLDLLWSIDAVFSGSIVDVLNGEGRILVPKQFLQDTLNRLGKQYPGTQFNVTTAELKGYHDESFVYVQPSGFDKDKMSPTPVQFDIRAEQYGKMLEIYERLAAVRAGYSPTSIFPYLTPDNSAKTATEITAEENLTRASIKEAHNLIVPVLNRVIAEILYQNGYERPNCQIQLGDYIGNKMQFDQNVRGNLASGIIPLEVAVKQVNNLNDAETQEYLEKIEADKSKEAERQSSSFGEGMFNEKDYYGDQGGNE